MFAEVSVYFVKFYIQYKSVLIKEAVYKRSRNLGIIFIAKYKSVFLHL